MIRNIMITQLVYLYLSALTFSNVSWIDNTEFLDIEQGKINGQLSFAFNLSEGVKILGNPDSLITPNYVNICGSYFDSDDFQYVFYGESCFELCKGQMFIDAISFRNGNGIYVIFDKITLKSTTTYDDVRSLFPNSRVVEDDDYTDMYIATSKNLMDDTWILTFYRGKLISFDYWMEC